MGWDRGNPRNSLNLPTLPKSTDLAGGAMGQPSPAVHGHTKSCVLGMPGPAATSPVTALGGQQRLRREHSTHPAECVSWNKNSVLEFSILASIPLAVSQEMTTMDPFSATPPSKSSKPRGKPRIPEAGLHPRVSGKQRCTLHVCLKWEHELVLASTASKAPASKFALEPKC